LKDITIRAILVFWVRSIYASGSESDVSSV